MLFICKVLPFFLWTPWTRVFASSTKPVAATLRTLKVLIDPGHGGADSGASFGNLKESEIVLKVGLLLQTKLQKSPYFSAKMTRVTDKALSLRQRILLAESLQADLLLSLHLNSNPNKQIKGFEFYFQNQLPPDEDALFLAAQENKQENERPTKRDLVEAPNSPSETNFYEPTKKNDIKSILDDLMRSNRLLRSFHLSRTLHLAFGSPQNSSTLRQAPFYVVTRASIPSVLVELGFVSNPKEAQKIITPTYQDELAEKLYRGLLNYYHIMGMNQPAASDEGTFP